MAKKFLTPIDLSKLEIQNASFQNLASAPGTPATGQFYLDTAGAINQPTYYNGSNWQQMAIRSVNTFTGKQTLAAPSASVSGSLNFQSGTGNTPVTGDMYNLAGVLTYYNGAAKTIAFTDSAITSTMYIGTTAVALNRASASLALTGITSIDGSAASATSAGKSTNLVGGNSSTLLGSLPYQSNVDVTTLLGPNTTATQKFLSMTGTGTNGAAPVWNALVNGDIPAALTGKSYNGMTLTATTGTFTLANAKTLTVNNTLTLSGTDGSTLAIGSGGTLGTAAYTAASAYATLTDTLNEFAAPVADVSMGGYKLTNLATPVNATDAVNKSYVDSMSVGLDVKAAVRASSTATVGTYGNTAGASGRGQLTSCPNTLDGVTLAANDRILVKDHGTAAANGIYVVSTLGTGANGIWDRATDADADGELKASSFTFVSEGTTNADTGWTLTTNGVIVVGGASGTAMAWAQFSGAGTIVAGAGMTKTGNQLDIGAGTGISVAADSVAIDTAVVVRKYAVAVGDNSATSIAVTHNLGTLDVTVGVYTVSGGAEVECDVTHTSTNVVTLGFAVAPSSGQYRCVVHG